MIIWVFRLLLSTLMLNIAILRAEARIEINKGVYLASPIGVVPFQWIGPGSVPENIESIIAADLRNSGKFDPIDQTILPQYPTALHEVQPEIWSKLGINIIVIGQIRYNLDSSYEVTYQLVNTSGKMVILMSQNSYKVNKEWLRYVGHTVSDELFEKLTSIKGAFRTRIAYIVQTDHDKFPYKLMVSDYDGHNQYLVRHSSQPLMSPTWSPDGNKLAYVTFESGSSSLVIQNLSNGVIRYVTSFPRHNGAPSFSLDGKKLAFVLSKTGSLNLYVMDLASGYIDQITNGHSNNTEPVWFPDNQSLIFTSDQTGYPQIYKININNKITQRITWQGLYNQNADISSDGKFIIMVSSIDGQQHITKQDLLTDSLQILSSTFLDETPSLAPNGTMVIYSSSQGMESVLNLISIDGRFKIRIPTAHGQAKFPAWSPYL